MTTSYPDPIAPVRERMLHELTGAILPYWMNRVADTDRGGYHGRIDGRNVIDLDSARSAILNTRILWTFASAYRVLRDPALFPHIQRASGYLESFFVDPVHGGVYWSVNT